MKIIKKLKLKKKLQRIGLESLEFDVPMAAHTSFKCGGSAFCFAEPKNAEQITELVRISKESGIEFLILGNGSNTLFSDAGFEGIVIYIGKSFSEISVEDNTVTAGAGALLSSVSHASADAGLSGLEFACGIPGSVGGGVYMNAGAYDGEISFCIKTVKSVDARGTIIVRDKDTLELSYRHSVFTDNREVILSASFELQPEDKTAIEEKMADYTQRRTSKQPLSYPSAGSFFKRPEGYFAGKLIEESGLKGLQLGGAMVSELHAGFIINKSNATASDVINLMRVVQETVKNDSGVLLEPEVKIIG